MKKDKKLMMINIFMMVILCYLVSCSTRLYTIKTSPIEAEIVRGRCNSSYLRPFMIGNSPVKSTITYFGKNEKYYFTAMKRGYVGDTIVVSKDSALQLEIGLSRLEGVDTLVFNPKNLMNKTFFLFPVDVDFYFHKGVGQLDKYEISDEVSKESSDNINTILTDFLNVDSLSYLSFYLPSDSIAWGNITNKLKDTLLAIYPMYLNYYSIPPTVYFMNSLDVYSEISRLPEKNKSDYWIYPYVKSIKPTGGRIAGNIGVSAASGAVEGYQKAVYGYSTVMYYPQAFNIDYSTLLSFYIIHPKTLEILCIIQNKLEYDVSKEKSQNEFVKDMIGELYRIRNYIELEEED